MAADCERIRPGMVAQPANTLSAAGLVASGLWIAARGGQDRRRMLFGAVVAAAGVGSIAYHGPGGRFAEWSHDAALAATLAVVAAEDLRALLGWRRDVAPAGYASAIGTVGALLAMRPATARAATAVLGAVVVVAESGLRRLQPRRGRRAKALAHTLVAGGILAYAAGRTGGPLCRPDSWLQPHGVWHLLAAAAMAAWAEAVLAEGAAS